MEITMNFKKSYLLISILLPLFIIGCSSGGTTSSSDSVGVYGVNSVTYTLPGGTFILPNGVQVTLGSTILSSLPGKITSTSLTVSGGNTDGNVGFSYAVYSISNGVATSTNLIRVSFSNPNVEANGLPNPSTTDVYVDAANAPSGDYAIQFTDGVVQNPTTIGVINLSVNPSNMRKASYIDMSAAGSLSLITASGYAASNIIIFGFADPTSSTANPSYTSVMQTACNSETSGTINLLSLGGQNGAPSHFTNPNTVVSNITAQINAYNSQLRNCKINGVDLDLEGDFSSTTITQLAQGFKNNGLTTSVAPQVYLSSGTNVDPANPTNLVLTSGFPQSNTNNYGPAIVGGFVNYINAQTYDTGGWTVGGYAENQVQFFSAIAQALNSTVRTSCSGTTNLCIPATTQILIGEVANGGAGGGGGSNNNNIFNSSGATSYNQASILSNLQTQINTVIPNTTTYQYINGVMMWSLNNDYAPNLYGDSYATAGAFSSTIFGATPPPSLPYFILQISNTGPDVASPTAYASATVVVNGQYWIFGKNVSYAASGVPIAPGANQLWGTKPSSQISGLGVVDSNNLDMIFSNGNTSFSASQIIMNGYPSVNSDILTPVSSSQFNCVDRTSRAWNGNGYTFKANNTYNVQINPTYKSCAVSCTAGTGSSC
jgi:hypothetical protein